MEEKELKKISTPIQDLVNNAQKDGTVGPVIGSIIIIILIITGGLYFFGSIILNKRSEIQQRQNLEQQNITIQVEETVKQSDSDEVNSIETDLKTTNIDSIDEDLDKLEIQN